MPKVAVAFRHSNSNVLAGSIAGNDLEQRQKAA